VVGELGRVLTRARQADRGGTVVESLWLRALAHHARGDEESALDDLDEALRLGVPAGYVRLFLDEGTAAVDLLRLAATRGLGAAEAAAALVSAAGAEVPETGEPAADHAPERVGGPLSARELDVLRLLDSDLAGPEIARRMFMSINTFRTHSRHIFTKLNVNTRRAAVARAKDLDLL
jgi:LuxR family maltose regulon positive regulatory protein